MSNKTDPELVSVIVRLAELYRQESLFPYQLREMDALRNWLADTSPDVAMALNEAYLQRDRARDPYDGLQNCGLRRRHHEARQ